jgi:hypothetical protein
MAELEPSKLVTRVRFPSPAPAFSQVDRLLSASLLPYRRRALLTHDDSGRREALEEFAALHDFLAEKFPLLKEE